MNRKPMLPRQRNDRGLRTIIVGAGSAGRSLARDLRAEAGFGLTPVGFLDDDGRKRNVARLPVLGPISALPAVAERYGVQAAIIAIPSLSGEEFRRVAELALSCGVTVRHLPSFLAAVERDAHASDLRALRLDHLIGRDEVRVVSSAARSVVAGRRVLVTGAGGSIGSELCRQVRGFGPAKLYLLDHDESNLHRLQLQLTGAALLDGDELIVADIRDRRRVAQIFDELEPEVVFHAAAHKHLPLLEQHPCEGVKTNVLGTANLVEAALDSGVDRFILISTDKAADPTSVLGATKRLAEMVLQANAVGPTHCAAVRFGNVLGSRGSFLEVLKGQVEAGESVTVTHPDVTRYFMTVEEAVGLVLEAAVMARYGETFVLDMGEPVRIVDLVRNYVAERNLGTVDIRFTGLRPGEKLSEALFGDAEERLPTAHPKITATLPAPIRPDFGQLLDELYAAAAENDRSDVRRILTRVMPEYTPIQRGAEVAAAFAVPYPDGF